ncbi:MAG: hypothetical protein JXA25_11875 [Anaerolineales bacterium]|nr:hypothetical protein [Anaerolineales bacterium]
MQQYSAVNRKIIIVLAVLIGLFLILAAPWIVQNSLDAVLENLMVVVENQPQFLSGIALFTLFYPFWRALCFIAGVLLLVMIPSIHREESWTIPAMLTAYAMPSIGGMFMFLPYVSWVKNSFPIPMVISWVGLLGFWSTLLLRKTDRFQKIVDWLTFTFIGMLATHSFVLGIAAARQLMTRPSAPLYEGLEWWILTMTGDINWIATLGLIVSIPLLVQRKRTGWLMALVSAISIFLIDAPAQLIRTSTLDYLYGSLLAAGLLAWLLIPSFKHRLIGDVGSEPADDKLG